MEKIINFIRRFEKQDSGFSHYSQYLIKYLTKLNVQLNPLPTRNLLNYPLKIKHQNNDGLVHFSDQALVPPLTFYKIKKKIVTVHDLILLKYPELFWKGGLKFACFDKWWYKKTLDVIQKADALIVDSESTKSDVIRYLRYPQESVHVVYLGTEAKFVAKPKKRGCNILYVGSECPHKNLETLLIAFAKLKKMIPEAKLVKVGEAKWPGAREKLIQLIKKLKIEGAVIFKDYVENIETEYQNADLFVFPTFYEGFGLPVLEAMAYGCPVVCSNTSSLPEIIGKAGVLVEPNNADMIAGSMHQVLINDRLRNNLIKKGLEQAKRFNWNKTAKDTLRVYQQVWEK